jgi:hypothetical protein
MEIKQRAITLQILKMEIWLLFTACPLTALDHCMKFYWIPTTSFQVKLRTKQEPVEQGEAPWLGFGHRKIYIL